MPQDWRTASRLTLPLTLKEQAAATWAKRQLEQIDHEQRVLVIAEKLFTLTADLHKLTARDRRTLRLAALVHDVGRRFGDKNHPADGARMIENEEYLPMTVKQRRAVVYLTRYHRGAVPKLGFDGILKRSDGRKSLITLLALLRAADGLDNRQLNPPAISITLKGRRLTVRCFVESESNRARKTFKRRKKFRLLEDVLDCRIDVEVERVESVQHVERIV